MRGTLAFVLSGFLAASVGAVPSSTPGAMSVEEIEADVVDSRECDQPRALELLLEVPSAENPQTLVSIHRAPKCWTDLMVLWQRAGDKYQRLRIFDEGDASAALVKFEGRSFLHLVQRQASTRYDWRSDLLMAVDAEGGLGMVPFGGETACEQDLPAMGDSFKHVHGGIYRFEDDAFSFEWNIRDPEAEFQPSSIGRVTGSFALQESDGSPSGLELVVAGCKAKLDDEE